MSEPTVFDYWLAEHAMHYQWQLNALRAEGINGVVDGEVVAFSSSVDTALAKFLDGKSFRVLTWEAAGGRIDVPAPAVVVPDVTPAPTPDVTPVVVPDPTPVAPQPDTTTPETVVVPDATPVAPTSRKTRKPVPHVDPATPAGGDNSNVASPAVPTVPKPTDGSSTPAA